MSNRLKISLAVLTVAGVALLAPLNSSAMGRGGMMGDRGQEDAGRMGMGMRHGGMGMGRGFGLDKDQMEQLKNLTPEQRACVKPVENTRFNAMQAANKALFDASQAARAKHHESMQSALDLTDETARKDAIRKAQDTLRTDMRTATDAFREATRKAQDTAQAGIKACLNPA